MQKIKSEGILSNSFYEASTLHKDITTISFINIDAKILNKTSVNWIQCCIKKIINLNQVGFIPGMQVCFNIQKLVSVINLSHQQAKDKKNMIIPIDVEKIIWKNPILIHGKNS